MTSSSRLSVGCVVDYLGKRYVIVYLGTVVIGCPLADEGMPLTFATDDPDAGLSLCSVDIATSTRIDPKICTVSWKFSKKMIDSLLRARTATTVDAYTDFAHAPQEFVLGATAVPVAGRCFGSEEMRALVDSSLDFWLTSGRYNDAFETKFAAYVGVKHAITTNSGSSSNLLCLAALTSPQLGEKALQPGDEVITVAAGFPTTINPIIQLGMVPVFVDIELATYNIAATQLEAAKSDRTRAIMIAHTLGNPFDINAVLTFAQKYDLWVIEDCCDALGAEYDLSEGISKPSCTPAKSHRVGSFGHLASFSFYPAHHITMGEGGAVVTNDRKLAKLVTSFRDWGRDCWCPTGKDNTCGCRFEKTFGDLPPGYDHKYVYSHLGYNLKITDMQAAIGLAQLEKIEAFVETRRRNMDLLLEALKPLTDILLLPRATLHSLPSWFGCLLLLHSDAGVDRESLLRFLNDHKIGTRLLFGGNLTKQPYMRNCKFRIVNDLVNTDAVMLRAFWIGVYPGLGPAHIEYIGRILTSYFGRS
ncbi:lipopolysaccharide biosynthesis protein RfbH [Solidesulfovibrio alcoholivorans]|uniref:lipopolysaccharide biosynthesis protein RfbH n=1 Tax=Solidesulfovibrio alcoholivorans TaxID=81406 RepID=UPI001B805E25|nr:lipopolysaccharide biosynthesis protein RfbH [Solidesulfovibrio alcoholivorans]